MPSACGHRFAELAPFIEERLLDGVRLPVLGLAGLLLTKEGMREKDRADRRVIEEALAALKAGGSASFASGLPSGLPCWRSRRKSPGVLTAYSRRA